MKSKLKANLTKPVSSTNLSLFRIFFGIVLLIQVSKLFARTESYRLEGFFRFPFPNLEFIQPFPAQILDALVYLAMFLSCIIILGVFTRWALGLLTVILFYFLLLDELYFNNHYYLFALLSFLLIFTQSDARFNLTALLKKKPVLKIPNWQYVILQLQVFIVFFFGGLAKVNSDWLSGKITQQLANEKFGDFAEFGSLFLSWSGMLFDLFIGFLLFWPVTRFWALILVVAFNLTNGWLFDDIGLFPISMIIACLLLFGSKTFLEQKLLQSSKKKAKKSKSKTGSTSFYLPTATLTYLLIAFFAFQFLYPLRHLVMPGNPEWTGQGHFFAWRMKSYIKEVKKMQFVAKDPQSGQVLGPINLGLDEIAQQRIGAMPHLVWSLGREVARRYRENGQEGFKLCVDYQVSFNGRPSQVAIDPDVDLATIPFHSWKKNNWILPLQ